MIICVTRKHYTLYAMHEPNGFDMSENCLPFAVTIAAHQLWTTIGAAQNVNTSCALLAAKSCALDVDLEPRKNSSRMVAKQN
jgi:hypothetical protein